jgi:hypothetical protein
MLVTFASQKSRLLDFSFTIPDSWTFKSYSDAVPSVDGGVERLIAAKNSSDNVTINVFCATLQREINPVDWLDIWLKQGGFIIDNASSVRTSYGILANVSCTKMHGDVAHFHRIATVKDGNRLFLIEANCPVQSGRESSLVDTVFRKAIGGFSLLNPTKLKFSEEFRECRIGKNFVCQFIIPISWSIEQGGDRPENGEAIIINNGPTPSIMGTIIAVIQDGSEQSEFLENTTLGKLAANDFSIISTGKTYQPVENEKIAILSTIHKARRGTVDIDIISSRAESRYGSFCAMLVTPSREANITAWAINRRAFEVFLDSLMPI